MSAVTRKLGRLLYEVAGVETAAIVTSSLWLRSPYLTDDEKRFVAERMRPEEIGHEEMMTGWGRALFGPRPTPPPWAAMTQRDCALAAQLPDPARFAHSFAVVHWNEANTLRRAEYVEGLLRRLHPDVAADYHQLVGEERGHVAWALAVWARLERDQPTLERMVSRCYDYAAAVYPTILSRQNAAAWKWLAEQEAVA
jgi:hypothetical protein